MSGETQDAAFDVMAHARYDSSRVMEAFLTRAGTYFGTRKARRSPHEQKRVT